MSKIKVSMDKKYRTVSGQPVTILGVDLPLEEGFSVVGLVHSSDGSGISETWSATGAYLTKGSSGRDLVECKPYETSRWTNL